MLEAFAVCALLAAAPPPEAPAPSEPPASAPDAKLADLAWMSGSWSGGEGERFAEEHWTDPRGGMMIGTHRDLKGERAVFFEFLRIEQRGRTIVYVASPRGRCPATDFWVAEISPQRVVFANPAHDYPQRVLYWREGAILKARTEGAPGGKNPPEEWSWKPYRLAP
jgi:hypothetical protein